MNTFVILGRQQVQTTDTAKRIYEEFSDKIPEWYAFCGSNPVSEYWSKILGSEEKIKDTSHLGFLRKLMDYQDDRLIKEEKVK